MSEAAVRGAFARDFAASGAALRRLDGNPGLSVVLTAVVPELVPGAGPAHLSYLLDRQKRRLSQIQIVWGEADGALSNRPSMLALGRVLQAYFLRRKFTPGRTELDRPIAAGREIAFKTSDGDGHSILLLIAPRPRSSADTADPGIVQSQDGPPLLVILSYLASYPQ
jgi:hypothetical protein